MKTLVSSLLFLAVVDIGFAFGLAWGLVALGSSYVVAMILERKIKNG